MIFYFARFITCISVAVPIRLLVFSIQKSFNISKENACCTGYCNIAPLFVRFSTNLGCWMFFELRNVLLFIDVISFELRYVLLFREVSSTLLALYNNYFGYAIPESNIPKSESGGGRMNRKT